MHNNPTQVTRHHLATEFGIRAEQVNATASLLNEGATVPFIARYRKERTGELDEVMIAAIRDRLAQIAEQGTRRAAIIKSLGERDLLTHDLRASLDAAETLSELEDIYLPYRPKRRTRAMIAKERGLEPLAKQIFSQDGPCQPETLAESFVDPEKKVENSTAALLGARDIMAEWVNEDQQARQKIRDLFQNKAVYEAKLITGKENEGSKFRDYFDSQEPIRSAAGHRVLAMFRGEKAGMLSLRLRPEKDDAVARLHRLFVRGNAPASAQVRKATEDAYTRLMTTSMEVETRMNERKRVGDEAIAVFQKNLRELLMASPLGRKSVLAIDPGYRTGAKLVCLDPQGKLLFNSTVFVTQSDKRKRDAAGIVTALCTKFGVDAIAIGNGTASRETERFIRELNLPKGVIITMVNESGASVYSASDAAREEFPNHDITVRGAVSIGRRLMDPLAELVKIDPKSIGVGQYQHDVDQAALKAGLDDVVVSCVNAVGVEINTASKQLLSYVSGLGPSLAHKIVSFRNQQGAFTSRKQLLDVPGLGPKAFEQCGGFLRISGARNPLDASAVHPERYKLVEQMAADLDVSVSALMQDARLAKSIALQQYVTDEVGLPTLQDIIAELIKPGRDPRTTFEQFTFSDKVHGLEDLKEGMQLPGIVTNVTNFGAFVDVGAHHDGLVHVSEIADRFVSDPASVVKAGQKVSVHVLSVDRGRKRVSLSMRAKRAPGPTSGQGNKQPPRRKPQHQSATAGKRPRKFEGGTMADAFSGLDL